VDYPARRAIAPQNAASGGINRLDMGARPTHPQRMTKKARSQQVYTLVVQVGRKSGDGLPDGATGAGLVCYASGVDEAEAVRETVALLKQADLAPLDVTGHGSLDERRAAGEEIADEEAALMQRARDENSVVVAQIEPFYDPLVDGDA